jgi:Xaa-Pro aminopeptidase
MLGSVPPKGNEIAKRRAEFAARLSELGIAAGVITDPRDFEYLVGVEPAQTLGTNPFTGPIATALIIADEGTSIVVGGAPTLADVAGEPGVSSVEFSTFEDLEPLRPRTRLGRAVAPVLSEVAPKGAAIGIEPSARPEGLTPCGAEERPSWQFVEVESIIGAQRAIKSDSEIQLLRHAIHVCDEAQAAAASAIASSVDISDVRATIKSALAQAGDVSSSLVEVSARSAKEGEPLRAGAFVITDIAPRVDSYWGDSCATRPWRAESPEDPRTFAAVRAALTAGIELARPGVRACDLDALMRRRASEGRCLPYTGAGGHGLGLDFHEMPRLTPRDRTILEPNMVLALEPGAYSESVAVRLEAVVVVVPGGCDVLSSHLGALT